MTLHCQVNKQQSLAVTCSQTKPQNWILSHSALLILHHDGRKDTNVFLNDIHPTLFHLQSQLWNECFQAVVWKEEKSLSTSNSKWLESIFQATNLLRLTLPQSLLWLFLYHLVCFYSCPDSITRNIQWIFCAGVWHVSCPLEWYLQSLKLVALYSGTMIQQLSYYINSML